jgi:hypothetical protein
MLRELKVAAISAALTVALWAPTAWATPFPGPDDFGYAGAAIPFNLRDISASGTSAFGGAVDDSVTGAIPIGFSFSFYGNTFSQAYIGSNGFVTFSADQSPGCCSGGPLPGTANPSNMVAGWFTDLISQFNGAGDILYQTVGASGSREFIVEYISNRYFSAGDFNTFEIILHEGTNDIELQYLSTTADGHNRSVGIENAGTGTTDEEGLTGLADGAQIGLQIVNDNQTTFSQQGFCISTGSTSCPTAQPSVPEPATLILVGAGLVALAVRRRRRTS